MVGPPESRGEPHSTVHQALEAAFAGVGGHQAVPFAIVRHANGYRLLATQPLFGSMLNSLLEGIVLPGSSKRRKALWDRELCPQYIHVKGPQRRFFT